MRGPLLIIEGGLAIIKVNPYGINELLCPSAGSLVLGGQEYLLLDLVHLLVVDHNGTPVHLREDHQLHLPSPQLPDPQSPQVLIKFHRQELRREG